jgi:hypothetical protein
MVILMKGIEGVIEKVLSGRADFNIEQGKKVL